MHRRQFLKSCFVAPLALLVGEKPLTAQRPEKQFTVAELREWVRRAKKAKAPHSAIFAGRQVAADGAMICWSDGIEDYWSYSNYIFLPTWDACEGLVVGECRLWWIGGREIWEIEHVGGEQVFRAAYRGEKVEWWPVGLSQHKAVGYWDIGKVRPIDQDKLLGQILP